MDSLRNHCHKFFVLNSLLSLTYEGARLKNFGKEYRYDLIAADV
jgi:hypothetical protein